MAGRTIRTVATRVEDRCGGVRVIELMDPEGWELPPFRPGAHIDLHLAKGLVRTYSLINPPEENDRYVIAVKREGAGRGGSAFVHERIAQGTEVGVSLPRGGVPLDDRPQVFLAGGIGVTPFVSTAAHLLRMGRRDFTLHLMTRGTPPLAGELARLGAPGAIRIHDTQAAARPDLAALIAEQPEGARLAFCGPAPMLAAFEAATAGRDPDTVHVERFIAPPPMVNPKAKPYTLVLRKSGLSLEVGAGQTMLDALLDHGVDLPWSCGGGICGACRLRWLEGEPIHGDRVLRPDERKTELMACTAQSASDELVVDL
ncbi:MAG: PDR/VanB family oxidoreductase [Salipiger thiooxidans]|uniref:PDR/VanB family oxidoreductase n=1 Tax=Salipiger thiooxidans TaxID=282683 RepID=UPI001CFA72AF|nr:PDR/VanB family oxidoreductase [Salipiger thiooxidans]